MRNKSLMLLALFMLLCLSQSMAQPFNKKFFYSLGKASQYITPADIITDGPGYSCVLGYSKPAGSTSEYSKDIYFQKTDFSGNIALHKYYRLNGTDSTAILEPTKIVKTTDNGYIAVGYYTITRGSNVQSNPFAAKFDVNGKFVWGQKYNSISGAVPNTLGVYGMVNITPVVDDSTIESYIITFSNSNDSGATYNNDVYVHALRINGSGTLMWHYRYIPSNRSTIGYYEIEDYASALTYANDGNKSMYFIGGNSVTQTTTGTPVYYLFFFGINKNGGIVNTLSRYYVPTKPFFANAIYDNTPGKSGIAIAYTMGASTFPIGNSAFALTKLDLNFNVIFTNAYYTNNDVENYASAIAKTSDNNYILACGTSPLSSSSYNQNNALLKTDQLGNVIFFKRYNVAAAEALRPRKNIISYFNSAGTIENYAIDGDYTATSLATNTSLRLFTTDASGSTCGVVADVVNTSPYQDSVMSMTYSEFTQQGNIAITLDSIQTNITDSVCDIKNPAYKSASEPGTAGSTEQLSVYPSLLEDQNTIVNIDVTLNAPSIINIKLFSIDGRSLGQHDYTAAAGINHLIFNLPNLATGNYIFHVKSTDGSIMQAVKLFKQ